MSLSYSLAFLFSCWKDNCVEFLKIISCLFFRSLFPGPLFSRLLISEKFPCLSTSSHLALYKVKLYKGLELRWGRMEEVAGKGNAQMHINIAHFHKTFHNGPWAHQVDSRWGKKCYSVTGTIIKVPAKYYRTREKNLRGFQMHSIHELVKKCWVCALKVSSI